MRRSRTARASALGLMAVLATLFTTAPAAGAAAPTSAGTEFWIGFTANVADVNVNTLYIAGTQATTGTVELPGMGFTKSFSVTPGTVTTVAMPAKSSIEAADGVERRAVHVTAGAPVSVYGLNHFGASSDAFLALPVDVLGTDYLNLGWRSADSTGNFFGTQLGVVASADGTTVTVTPSQAVGGHAAGVPFTVQLDRGDMYQLRNEADPDGDLTGSRVTADKPVAVFGGSRISDSPSKFDYAGDHHVEQMPPTSAWGKAFLTVPLATRTKGDTFRVLAQADGTTVKVDGTAVGTIDRGRFIERILTARSQITADKPVLVAQYSHSSSFDGSTGDPFEMLIPPTEQFLADYTVTTPSSDFPNNWINVVAPTSAVGDVTLDGTAIAASKFQPIGTSGYSGAQVQVSVGSHRLRSASPFGAYTYGWNTYDSYGYPGGLSLAPVAAVRSVTVRPDDPTPPVGTEDCVTASVTDGEGRSLSGVRVDFAASGANTSSGFATTNGEGDARHCYTGDTAGPDTVTANVGTVGGTTTIDWQPAATNEPPTAAFGGSPTSPKSGEELTLDASSSSDDKGIASYTWDFGDGTTGTGVAPRHTYATPGTYTITLTVADEEGLTGTVSHEVTVQNRPPSAAFTSSPAAPRSGDAVAFDGTGSTDPDGEIEAYAWDFGDGTTGTGATPSHTYPAAGTYTVKLTVTDAGGATDSVSHTVTVKPRRTGVFVCRGTAVRLPLLGELSTANAPATPCKAESKSLLTVPQAPLYGVGAGLSLLDASTTQQPAVLEGTEPQPGDRAAAETSVASATVVAGTTVITVSGLESQAGAVCTAGGGVTLSGGSEIAKLVVNGKPIRTSDLGVRSLDVPLLLATLHVNSTVRTGDRVVQRAVWLESPLTGDVVLGEAVAGITKGACG